MSFEEATQLAMELLKLGVSKKGVEELLNHYPYEEIRRQLDFLPLRKATRPEAFIVEAIRHSYSPPKEHFYAPSETDSAGSTHPVDQSSEPVTGPDVAGPQGHGTPSPLGAPAPDGEATPWRDGLLAVPDADEADRAA